VGSKILKAEPLYLQAYNQLKNDIVEGNLKSGERLTDQQLAEWLGISRTPVREAARILCREGLLISENGVVTVYKPTLEDISQVYLLRASVESLATSVIAIKENKKEIVKILENITEKSIDASGSNDYKNVQELNRQFHNSIIEASKLEILKEIYEPLDAKMKIFRSVTLKKNLHRKISIEEHKQLIKYILEGDVLSCKAIAEKHILTAGKRAIKVFAEMEGFENSSYINQIIKYIDAHLE
jgi:DNA-binding GntR family transcriptional regulator